MYSAGKGAVALTLMKMVDEGLLQLEDPVCLHWPEFAEGGKDTITVRHLASHQSGLAAPQEQLCGDEAWDWGKLNAMLARQKPAHPPGSAHGYHAITFGNYLGELMTRVASTRLNKEVSTFSDLFQDMVGKPLGLDMHFGTKDLDVLERVLDVDMPSPPPPASAEERAAMSAEVLEALKQGDTLMKAMADPRSETGRAFGVLGDLTRQQNSQEWRQACVPATTGLANARSLARMYAGLSMDGVWPSDTTSCNSETGSEDLFFVSPEAIRTFSEVQVEGVDRILCLPARFSEGFQVSLPDPLFSFGLSPGSFGHAGSGGSLGFADPESQISFGYTLSSLQFVLPFMDSPAKCLVRSIQDILALKP